MEKLRMSHDSADDFDNPMISEGHRRRRYVLYRLNKTEWIEGVSLLRISRLRSENRNQRLWLRRYGVGTGLAVGQAGAQSIAKVPATAAARNL